MKQILLCIICALVGVSEFGQTAKRRIDYLKEHLLSRTKTLKWLLLMSIHANGKVKSGLLLLL